MFFTDSLNGWISGDSGIIVNTTDKGNTWNFQNSSVGYDVISLFFLNNRIGYALSWELDNKPPNHYGTRILSTTNGGYKWSNYLFPDTNLFLNTIYFRDSLNGFIGGTEGKIFYTTNAGNNWVRSIIDSGIVFHFPVHEIKFFDPLIGFAAGGAFDIAGVIWNTTNGGRNWNVRIVGPEPVNDLHFFDSLNIIGIGGDYEYGPSNVKTSTGGEQWDYHELGIFGISNVISFRTENEAWSNLSIVDSFLVSTNRGVKWEVVPAPGGALVTDICFTDSRNGWAVGMKGALLKYNNDINDIDEKLTYDAGTYELFQNYPNPFNPVTKIKFNLPFANQKIKLSVYDILGKEIAILINKNIQEGNCDAVFEGSAFPSGIYFYTLSINDKIHITRKMVLMK